MQLQKKRKKKIKQKKLNVKHNNCTKVPANVFEKVPGAPAMAMRLADKKERWTAAQTAAWMVGQTAALKVAQTADWKAALLEPKRAGRSVLWKVANSAAQWGRASAELKAGGWAGLWAAWWVHGLAGSTAERRGVPWADWRAALRAA